MNKEFEEHGLAFRIKVPTQEEIDDWQQRNQREHIAKNLVEKN